MSTKPIKVGFVNIDFTNPGEIALTDALTLRKVIGILGMLLPLLLILVLALDIGYNHTLPSISHYYYTRASAVFTTIVSLLAVFLIIYKGHDRKDFIASSLAGIFSLLMVFFPTDNLAPGCPDPYHDDRVTILKSSDFRTAFHYVSATIFLGSLAYMSLFLFTKTDKTKLKTDRKKMRNGIYYLFGSLMVLALLIAGSRMLTFESWNAWFDNHHMTFWMETLAVESFGISWLVKGEFVLKDKPVIVE